MGSPDRIVSARLKSLHDNLYYLYTESALLSKFADYETDIRLKKAVERALQVCVEALLDIGRNIIAREGLPQPEERCITSSRHVSPISTTLLML